MYGDALDTERLDGAILLVDLDSLHLGQRSDAVVANELPKDGVEPVQVRGLVEGDEELRPIGAWALIGHGEEASFGVPQCRPDLVLKGAAPDGFAALGILGGRVGGGASLHHELRDQAVEGGFIVVARGAEGKEVLGARVSVNPGDTEGESKRGAYLGSLGNAFAKDLDLEIAE